MDHRGNEGKRGFFGSWANIVLIVFLVIGTFLLVTEHRAHMVAGHALLGALVIGAILLMLFFLRRGDDGARDAASDGRKDRPHVH